MSACFRNSLFFGNKAKVEVASWSAMYLGEDM